MDTFYDTIEYIKSYFLEPTYKINLEDLARDDIDIDINEINAFIDDVKKEIKLENDIKLLEKRLEKLNEIDIEIYNENENEDENSNNNNNNDGAVGINIKTKIKLKS